LSRLIAQEDLRGNGHAPQALNLRDVEQKAAEAVDRARGEARRILQETVARAREVEQVAAARGRQAGFAKGLDEGRQKGRAEALEAETARLRETTASVRDALLDMVGQIEQHRHEVLADDKQALLELAVDIAARICRTRVAAGGDHLAPLLEEVIEAAGRRGRLVVRVNPADAEAVAAFLDDVHGRMAGDDAHAVRIVPDAGVERGGCIADREGGGRIDAQLETQIARLVAELLGADAVLAAGHADTGGQA
jgi:flagellar biosynthesis/type III secretory pathway protein FliH